MFRLFRILYIYTNKENCIFLKCAKNKKYTVHLEIIKSNFFFGIYDIFYKF